MGKTRQTAAIPPHPFADARKGFTTASGKPGQLYSLPALAKTYPNIKRLPVSIRIVLESVLRNCDGKNVAPEHVLQLAHWQPNAPRSDEIPFGVARVVLQDFTGVPLLEKQLHRDAAPLPGFHHGAQTAGGRREGRARHGAVR